MRRIVHKVGSHQQHGTALCRHRTLMNRLVQLEQALKERVCLTKWRDGLSQKVMMFRYTVNQLAHQWHDGFQQFKTLSFYQRWGKAESTMGRCIFGRFQCHPMHKRPLNGVLNSAGGGGVFHSLTLWGVKEGAGIACRAYTLSIRWIKDDSVKFLVTGANGFIASGLVEQLLQAGHQLVLASRRRNTGFSVNQVTAILMDFNQCLDPEAWIDHLQDVDGVINCAGLLRESIPGDYERIHFKAPQALANACLRCGVKRFVQISAIGDAETSDFIASKHRFDEWLLTSGLDCTVIRSSVVVSLRGSYGGTSLLRALSALPGLVVLPGKGEQKIQPVLLEDLVSVVVHQVERKGDSHTALLCVAGPDPVTLRDFLLAQRQWLQLPAGLCIHIPLPLVRIAVQLAERFGGGPMGQTVNTLLERGNTVPANVTAARQENTGIQPRSVIETLRLSSSFVQDRWHARLYGVRPIILFVLSCLWILSGISGLVHGQVGFAPILNAIQIPTASQGTLVLATSVLDIALGVALWLSRWRFLVLGLMTLSVLTYTAALAVLAPGYWLSPLGGLAKNLPLLVLLAISGVTEKQR
ncbi:epimerase [Elysia marginata]|uniref:NADH dehydrogenase [ubiquinone] 1 alpha subcomplex subunit 9, mitochondrial n=1 Tax=Elysia marginata TaxID=1093978 RepID=A0AAV4ETH4_9GAST|nr:epimerase [Elysia marginata]